MLPTLPGLAWIDASGRAESTPESLNPGTDSQAKMTLEIRTKSDETKVGCGGGMRRVGSRKDEDSGREKSCAAKKHSQRVMFHVPLILPPLKVQA